MFQEITFQVQEFYSNVLWCAYSPWVPEVGAQPLVQSPGGARRLFVFCLGFGKEGFSPIHLHSGRGKESKPSHLGIKEQVYFRGRVGEGKRAVLFPERT